MKGTPNLYVADDLINYDCDTALIDGRWVMSRPLGFQGLALGYRLKLAWRVFTGRYDALCWEGQ